jgi:hypothetical protein
MAMSRLITTGSELPPQADTFRFLDLPTELQLEVLREALFADVTREQENRDNKIADECGATLLSLACVSKYMRGMTYSVYYSEGRFDISKTSTGTTELDQRYDYMFGPRFFIPSPTVSHWICCSVECSEKQSIVCCSVVLFCLCGPLKGPAAGSVYMTYLRCS